ncbi:FimV/HubP family polar landmark protein, partial [Salinivibrio sp. HTSP]
PEPEPSNERDYEFDSFSLDELGEFGEDDALSAALEEQRELESYLDEQQEGDVAKETPERDERDISDLDDDDHQVGGLNMEALLSESDDDTPLDLSSLSDEEAAVWQADNEPEPEAESEDWSQQPAIDPASLETFELEEALDEDLLSEGEAESELIGEEQEEDDYISIEELMRDDGSTPDIDPDKAEMNLNVGLDEFPDVLEDISAIDVDGDTASTEASTNLDLAKAYLEMNDIDGAISLLEKVMQSGNKALQQEARQLLEQLR